MIASMRGENLRSKDESGFSQGYSLVYAAFVELGALTVNSRHAKDKFVPSCVLSGKKNESLFYYFYYFIYNSNVTL